MTQKTFNKAAGTIFLVVGALHLYRAFQNWEMLINNWPVPFWLSVVAGLVLLYLSHFALTQK
jgi:uncharacterized membrane protein HdeD (DUF308 family)